MATNKLAMIYISSPVHMSPWRDIGMNIFRVIGWLTNNAALMSPIHSMAAPRYGMFFITFAIAKHAPITTIGANVQPMRLQLKPTTNSENTTSQMHHCQVRYSSFFILAVSQFAISTPKHATHEVVAIAVDG